MIKSVITLTLFFWLFTIDVVRSQIPTNGLMLWYPFSGNAKDSSGNGNDGTASNVTLVADRFGSPNKAYRFYGLNNGGPSTIVSKKRIRIAGNAPRSVSFWFNWYSVSTPEAPGLLGWGSFNGKGKANWFHIKQDSSLVKRGHNQDLYTGPNIIHTHRWYHVVYTYNGADGIFYVNGQVKAFQNFRAATDSTVLQIGHSTDPYLTPFDWPAYFDGAIDGIRIYNRELNPAEVNILYNEGNVMPLQLLNFSCSKNNEAVQLMWQTTHEMNTDHFCVQRSSNGKTFSNIFSITANNKVGVHKYNAKDLSPAEGINYYRLKMADKDGKTTYSSIVTASFAYRQMAKAFPNPCNGHFNLLLNSEAIVTITSQSGTLIKSTFLHPVNGQSLPFNLQQPPGIYLIKITTSHSEQVSKLVIE